MDRAEFPADAGNSGYRRGRPPGSHYPQYTKNFLGKALIEDFIN